MILMLKDSSNLGTVHFYYFHKHDLTQKETLDEVFGRWETGFNFFENWPKIVLEMGDWFFQNGSREHNFLLLNKWSKTLMFFINNHFLSSKATQEQGFLSFLWMKTVEAPSEKCGNGEIWWKKVGNWGIQPPPFHRGPPKMNHEKLGSIQYLSEPPC